jgi:hypothetical protein
MKIACILIALAAAPALADGHRTSDVILDKTGMSALLSGKVVTFFDGSRSTYARDGSYGYTYTDDGPVWRGQYTLDQESRVCVIFENGESRCDMFVMDGERAVLITRDGTRFPVRNLTVYED